MFLFCILRHYFSTKLRVEEPIYARKLYLSSRQFDVYSDVRMLILTEEETCKNDLYELL